VGVSTFDIARISRALLDVEPFTSPYQRIAADVDKSGSVDGGDMLFIRNFILRKTTSLPGGVWRFIDKNYIFKNPENPFGEDFPEVVNIANAKATEAVNFIAIKLGDANDTYTSNLVSTVVRSNKALTLNVEDINLVAGNEYTVNLTADDFNAAAFQGTFGIANTTIKSVKAGDLAHYSDGNFGIFANEITTSWNGQAKGAANVFSITFTANKSGKLSEMMTVGSSLTPAIANDATGTEMNINLKFSTGKVTGGEFALYQNIPNPITQETLIGFNMPKNGAAKLTIYNVEGKVVMTKNIDAKAGVNQVAINKSDLTTGILYYRLETAEHSATKKMIVVE
jgi:Secretion system C-terminal sorting domain/Dockerin type I domain